MIEHPNVNPGEVEVSGHYPDVYSEWIFGGGAKLFNNKLTWNLEDGYRVVYRPIHWKDVDRSFRVEVHDEDERVYEKLISEGDNDFDRCKKALEHVEEIITEDKELSESVDL